MNRPIVLILMLLGAHPCFAVDVIAAPAETAQTGMTWGVSLAEAPPGIVLVGCHGLPVSPIGSCDAYVGDTSCSASLPVLCVNIDGREMPPGLHPTFYSGWLAGWGDRVGTARAWRYLRRSSRCQSMVQRPLRIGVADG